jgi:4-carboxymuconolactone decarboxylase
MSKRLTKLVPELLNDEQRALYDRVADGPRRKMGVSLADQEGGLIGPFNAYLHTPELGGRLESAGVGLRELTALAPRLREIAILVSARHHRAQFEWFAHAQIARTEGVEADAIEAIHQGADPAFTDPTDAAVYRFAVELLETHRVSPSTFEGVANRLSERERVELVFVLGYYSLVSMTLNAFEVELPEGTPLPFE